MSAVKLGGVGSIAPDSFTPDVMVGVRQYILARRGVSLTAALPLPASRGQVLRSLFPRRPEDSVFEGIDAQLEVPPDSEDDLSAASLPPLQPPRHKTLPPNTAESKASVLHSPTHQPLPTSEVIPT